jgi:hypothetical protein
MENQVCYYTSYIFAPTLREAIRCVLLAIEPFLIPTDGPKVPHQHCLQDSIQ